MSAAAPVDHVPRHPLLGVGISVLNMDLALAELERLRHGEGGYVCVTPAHSLMDCVADDDLRRVFNEAALVTPDGMGVVFLLRLWGHRHVDRVYGPDLMSAAMDRGRSLGWTHFLLGGTETGLEQLRRTLEIDYPGVSIAGGHAPPFRTLTAVEEADVRDRIRASGADFVWVALGSPRQEQWMARATPDLPSSVLIGIGAAFDFLAGEKPQAPRWIQRSGFEWLFRLASEPRRLWPRYRQYPRFVRLAVTEYMAERCRRPERKPR